MSVLPFNRVMRDASRGVRKIPQREFLAEGRHPVVDQGQQLIAGFCNAEEGLCTDVPAIVFGDHTRCVKYIDEPFVAGADGVKILVPIRDNDNPRYLYHALRSADIPNLGYSRHFKLVKELSFVVPDHERQDEIAAFLDAIEAQCAAANEQLNMLDELVKSRFVEMFGDPIENPKGWVKKPIGEVYEVGSAKRVYARDQVSEGVPFLRLGDLTNRIQHGVESCDLFITEELYEEHKAKGLVPDAGDILVTARGTMGLCYEVKPEDRFYFQDGMITWLHAKSDSPLPVFLTSLFANEHFDEDLHEHTSGTTVKYLSIKTLSQLPMVLPPLALQQEFAAFVRQVDKLKFETQQAIDKLQMLYDSLAQEYFGS